MVKLFCAIVGVVGSAFSVRVDDESDSVDDLKKAIKKEKPSDFKDIDADKLQLFLAKKGGAWLTEADVKNGVKGADEFKALDSAGAPLKLAGLSGTDVQFTPTIEDVKAKSTPVHVLVVVPDQQQAASIKKQLRYKGMSTEASCRKFLDALAQNLATLYDFECSYGDVTTIGDVFSAVKNDEWGFRLKRGRQLTSEPLPSFFTEDEWKDLKDLNWRTNRRIHDGKVPTTSKGKSYVILPHAIFSDDRVDRYKTIATRGSVVFEATEFEVKDEDEFSGSSRSSSGRSDIA